MQNIVFVIFISIVNCLNVVATLDPKMHANHYQDFNLTDVKTQIYADKLRNLLLQTKYNKDKINYLYRDFTEGFDFGYRGPDKRRHFSDNIPVRVGSKPELWNKVMKEVKLGRYAGPFRNSPHSGYFMQSHIGLVLKARNQTCLIFHLSYDFGTNENKECFNYHTPAEQCLVK